MLRTFLAADAAASSRLAYAAVWLTLPMRVTSRPIQYPTKQPKPMRVTSRPMTSFPHPTARTCSLALVALVPAVTDETDVTAGTAVTDETDVTAARDARDARDTVTARLLLA